MNITLEDLKHLTKLSKLQYDANKADSYLDDLKKIIGYIQRLEELDLDKVEPTEHLLSLNNVFREDEIKSSMDVENILKNAPEVQENCFHVPQIVEG